MRIRQAVFQGMFPRRDARLLPENNATLARDARMLSGTLQSYRDVLPVETLTLSGFGIKDIFRWRASDGDFWFRFPDPVNVVRGPTSGDVWERVYWTGDRRVEGMALTYAGVATSGSEPPTNRFLVGVPAPTQSISATVIEPDPVTVAAVNKGVRPIRVTTSAPHGFETDDIVRFVITAEAAENDEIDLADFLNDAGGYQVIRISDTEFALQSTDGVNQDYSNFTSGSVERFFSRATVDTRFYVHTYVNLLGEEGPPSDPGAAVVAGDGQDVDLDLPPLDNLVGVVPIERRRVYRTATGLSGAEFQLVADLDISQTQFLDKSNTRTLGEVIESAEWDPPDPEMRHLNLMASGVMVGGVRQDVCFSEPYRPHAWPGSFRIAVDHVIVAIGVFDQYTVVGTEGQPYIIAGTDPRSMQPQKLAVTQACLSSRSMVSMGYGCVYASSDGLVFVDASGARVVTETVLTPEEWEEYAPETIHAYELDGRYVGFFDNGERQGGFVFDPRRPDEGFAELDFYAKAGYRDTREPRLYLLTESDELVLWDGAETRRPFLWRSREWALPVPLNVSCARVIADDYADITFRLYAGGVLRYSGAVTSERPFRLPAGYMELDLQFEVEGVGRVREVVVADAIEELSRV